MSVCSSCGLATWFLEQLEPGSEASESQPALQPVLQLSRNYMACKLGNPCKGRMSLGAMAVPLACTQAHGLEQLAAFEAPRLAHIPRCAGPFWDSAGMSHMGSPTSPLCSTAVSSLMPISCEGLSPGTPQAEPSSTGGEFFQYAVLRAKMGRFLPLASYVLQGPRFHPSCWVTSIWPLPPGRWGKRGRGRKAISLEEEMQKLRGYLYFTSSG